MKPRLIILGPLPPPFHGVTISTGLMLANADLREVFDVQHVDTSDHRTGENIGRWDVTNLFQALWAVARLIAALRGRPGTVYLPLSQSRGGLLRDGLFILAGSLRGWKVAIHLRGSDFPWFYPSLDPFFRWFVRRALSKVDSFGVMGQSLRGVFGDLADPAKIAVVPNGTPEALLQAAPGTSQRVLFIANRRPRKGVHESVRCALLVLQRHPHAEFVFVGNPGDDAYEADLRRLAAPAGDRIRFLDAVSGEEKARHYAEAALLLFPPVEPEGHPRVVLEAVAAGLPVVATDRGAISETVVHGVNGFVLDAPEPAQLADRVAELLESPEQRARMGEASLRLYHERFSQQKADQRVAEWLATLV